MTASIRKQLKDALEPHLPGIKIIPAMRNVDVPDRPFAQIALMRLEKLPAAPLADHLATFTVTIVTPLTTPLKAEDDLDALVGDLLYAIDELEGIDWSEAQKVMYGDRHLAYDVTVTANTKKN